MRMKGDRGVVRYSVQDMWKISLLPCIPRGEDSLEFLGDKTTVVDFNGSPGNALGGDCVRQCGEGQLVREECVSPFSEQPETLCHTIAVPKGECDQVIPRRMENGDEFCQCFECGRDSSTGAVGEGGLEWKSPGTFSIGDCLGGAGAVAPFEHWIGALKGSDLERDPLDRIKANVRITWRWKQTEEVNDPMRRPKGAETHRWPEL